jgi:hypothetical protein
MRSLSSSLLALLFLIAVPDTVLAQDDAVVGARYDAARAWVDLLNAGEFEKAGGQVNAAVAAQLGAAQLETVWAQLGAQLGELESLEPKEQRMEQGYHVVVLKGVFGAGTFDVQVVMADDHTVAGFFIRPPGS